jgi:hypothetical protein
MVLILCTTFVRKDTDLVFVVQRRIIFKTKTGLPTGSVREKVITLAYRKEGQQFESQQRSLFFRLNNPPFFRKKDLCNKYDMIHRKNC